MQVGAARQAAGSDAGSATPPVFDESTAKAADAAADAADAAAAVAAAPEDDASEAPLPLAQRSVDYWLLAWYGVFLFTVLWTDLHNFSASLRTAVQWGGRSWAVRDLERLVMAEGGSLIFPPRVLSYFYFRWARTADPLLFQNPIWWQCIEWVNLLCLMPFSAWALFAFARGDNSVRLPAIIVSAFTFYSLILCIGSSLFGDEEDKVSKQKTIFFFIYVPCACPTARRTRERARARACVVALRTSACSRCARARVRARAPARGASPPRPAPPTSLAAPSDLLFPCIVVARLWRERPFSRPLAPGVDLALKAAASVVFASFAAAGVAWYFTCESETRGDVIDARCPKCKD